jgi:hypothetical protein
LPGMNVVKPRKKYIGNRAIYKNFLYICEKFERFRYAG